MKKKFYLGALIYMLILIGVLGCSNKDKNIVNFNMVKLNFGLSIIM